MTIDLDVKMNQHRKWMDRMEMIVHKTSERIRREYDDQTGFPRINYVRFNVEKVREIADIFAIRCRTYPFQEELYGRHLAQE